MLRAMRAAIAAALLAAACGGARSDGGGTPPPLTSRFGPLRHSLDLFDAARFGREPSLRPELERSLGLPAGALSGKDATDRAADALLVEADRILAEDRLDEGAQQARTLVAFDRQPPQRADLWKRMMEMKAIARGAGPLARNARLRLAAYCWRAFDDAQKTIRRLRVFAVSHCLYPLHDSDPEPYFAHDPALRPPPPDWGKLLAHAVELLQTSGDWARLERARRTVMGDLQAIRQSPAELPVDPVPGDEAPVVAGVPIQDWQPLATVSADLQKQVDRLRVELQADGRGQLTLQAAGVGGTAADLLAAAALARSVGAQEVLLLVRTEQTVKAPPGDAWPAGQPVAARAGVIAVSLAPLGTTADSGGREPRRVEFERGLELHLVVGATKWTLTSPGGVIADLPAGDAGLASQLAQVQTAFSDEVTLVIVPEPAATYASVVAAAAAAAYRDGKPLFRLGLGKAAPRARAGGALAKRIALRGAAAVTITPDALAPHASAARACYQDALEKSPTLAGAVRLEAAAGSVVRIGKADATLTRCATQALTGAMKSMQTGAADVVFSVKR
jgi:hypothetical protein